MNLVEILNRSRITINIHHKSDLSVSGKLNMRMFETTGCGAFLLTDAPRGLEEFYTPGKEVLSYSTPEELVDLVDRYLDDDNARQDVAAAGQERAYKDHTYFKRVRFLLNTMGLASQTL